MAACYCDEDVTFHDIAFHITDKARLAGKWRMICEGESGIRVTVRHVYADDRAGEARIVDEYQFGRSATRVGPDGPWSTRSRRVSAFAAA